MFIGKNDTWHEVQNAYIGVNGEWVPETIRLSGKDGRWVECYDNEVKTENPTISIDKLSYRSGGQLQGELLIDGVGLAGAVEPFPKTGAYFKLATNTANAFENFSSGSLVNVVESQYLVDTGVPCLQLNSLTEQYFSSPLGDAGYDLLSVFGSEAGDESIPHGIKYWELGGKLKVADLPEAGVKRFVMHSGTPTQNIAIYYNSNGDLVARFKNGGYLKELTLEGKVKANEWLGFTFRHRLSGMNNEYRHLDFFSHDGNRVTLNGDIQRTILGITYNEFDYWTPAPSTPILFNIGVQDPTMVDSPYWFMPETTNINYTISPDGLSLSGNNIDWYNAQPSGMIQPNTGRYYLELLNGDSFDMQLGVTDSLSYDLNEPAGIIGWAVNTYNGRLFAKQIDGGTDWTTAIPSNSTIGFLYDSIRGNMEIYVDGVKRADPFPVGTITNPVKFVTGGVAETPTTKLYTATIRQDSASWAYTPEAGLLEFPFSQQEQAGITTYSEGKYSQIYIRNAPMASDNYMLTSIDPSLKLEVMFRAEDGTTYTVNDCIMKQLPTRVTMFVPKLPEGNYHIIARHILHGSSTPKLFTIRNQKHRKEPLRMDFANTTEKTVKKNLMACHHSWGGANGGVVVENVTVDFQNGYCELKALGDQYTGDVLGVDRIGNPSGFNTRIGACLVTRDYYGAASYRVTVKPAELTGVCNALWSFHYEKGYEGFELYDEHTAAGLHQSGSILDGYYTVRNHEIDIEFPSALKTDLDQEQASYQNAKFNTWLGELRNWDVPNNDVPVTDPMYSAVNDPSYWSEYTDDWVNHGVNLADSQEHILRYDWHMGPNARVDFYIDDVPMHTVNTAHIPNIAGRFWVGLWFPSGNVKWAGATADWVEQNMLVSKIEILPFENEDIYIKDYVETYPNDVFRDIKNFIPYV